MAFEVSASVQGMEKAREKIRKLTGPQFRQVQAEGLNDTAAHVQSALRREMGSAFDRPTRYITNSIWVNKATPANLQATIAPTYGRADGVVGIKGGKTGVDPQQILRAQEFGGRRKDKKSEVALRRVGILPHGFQTVIPKTPYPGSDDGYGNLRGAFLQRLLSYLQAYSEQGFKANMKTAGIRKMRNQQHIGSIDAQRTFKTTLGVRFFVSRGNLRDGSTGHLAPGIWAASGTHDVVIKPVVLFVRNGTYKPRLGMKRITDEAGTAEYLARRTRRRIYNFVESIGAGGRA